MLYKGVGGDSAVDYSKNLHSRFRTDNKSTLDLITRDLNLYTGLNYGQWPDFALKDLLEAKKPVQQLNFVQQKINSLVGHLILNPNNSTFETEDADNTWSIIFNTLKSIDSRQNSWRKAYRNTLLKGMLHGYGIVEMFKDYRINPNGSVGLRDLNETMTLFDPNWSSDNINDNKAIIQTTWLTAPEIKEVYKSNSEELDNAIKEYEHALSSGCNEVEINKIADRSSDYYNMRNGQYLVIQITNMETVKYNRVFDMDNKKFISDGTPEYILDAMMAVRGSSLKDVPSTKKAVKVFTSCPGLSMKVPLVDNKMHPMQIGRYPLFLFSAFNINGSRFGYANALYDTQISVNKNRSLYSYSQQQAINGAELVEDDFFADKNEYIKYKSQKNIPNQTFRVSTGKLSTSRPGIATRPREAPPADMISMVDRDLSYADLISSTPPALAGGEGKSGESAQLFESKREAALTSLRVVQEAYEDFDHEITDAYQFACKQIYAGQERTMRHGSDVFNLNDGTPEMDITKAPILSVVVVPSKSGMTIKRDSLNKLTQVQQYSANPLFKARVEQLSVDFLPNITPTERDDLYRSATVYAELLELRMVSEAKQIKDALNTPPNMGMGLGGNPPATGPSQVGSAPIDSGGFSIEGSSIKPDGGVPIDVNNQNQLGQN